jgi:hypothetical protein
MAKKAVTRANLYDAGHRAVGLSNPESKALAERVIKAIADCLEGAKQ